MPFAESIATLFSHDLPATTSACGLFLLKSLNVRLWCIMRLSRASSRLILSQREKYPLPLAANTAPAPKLERSQTMRREA
jgi:hypothetical protein